jgi:hypothetical protein
MKEQLSQMRYGKEVEREVLRKTASGRGIGLQLFITCTLHQIFED